MVSVAKPESITVVIWDDDRTYYVGLEMLLKAHNIFWVLKATDDPEEALYAVDEFHPNLFIVDLLEGNEFREGIRLIRNAAQLSPNTRIVALTAHFWRDLAIQALRAGAHAYCYKGRRLQHIETILPRVALGQSFIDPDAARLMIDQMGMDNLKSPNSIKTILTPREAEVLRLMAQGRSNKEIAAQLGIAVSTVKTHIENIRAKLPLGPRQDARLFPFLEDDIPPER